MTKRASRVPWLQPGLSDEDAIMLQAEHCTNPLGRRISVNGGHWPVVMRLVDEGQLVIEAEGDDVSGYYVQYALAPPKGDDHTD